jgi:transcriptional regulator with XRE-family HTH domain
MELHNRLNWQEVVFKCLGDLKTKYPRFADADLAKKIDMSASSFNRIKNGRNKPRVSNLIKIVIGSGNKDMLAQAISLVDEELGQTFEKTLAVTLEVEDKIVVDKSLEQLLNDSDLFITYLMAGMPNGVSLARLSQIVGGVTAKQSTKKLILSGVIEEKNEHFFREEGNLVRSFESVKRHLNTYAKFYNPEHVGMGRNYVSSLFQGLNKEALKKVQDVHKRAHKEIQDIVLDESNRGDYPMFSVTFCDTLTTSETESPEGDK